MNEPPTGPLGKPSDLRRIRFSRLLSAGLSRLFGLTLSRLPLRISKMRLSPAGLLVRAYDEALGAPFRYRVGLPLAVAAYSIILSIGLMANGRVEDREPGNEVEKLREGGRGIRAWPNNDMHRSRRRAVHVVTGNAARRPGDVCSLDALAQILKPYELFCCSRLC